MKIKIFLTIIIIVFLGDEVACQKYLLLDKVGGKQRHEFHEGEELSFRLRGEDHFSTAKITLLQDSLIIFEMGVINIKDIDAIKMPRSRMRSMTPTIRVAGIGLILIDQFNHMVIAGESFSLNSGVLKVGGALVALSYLIDLTTKNKFKIRGNRRLRIMDVEFG